MTKKLIPLYILLPVILFIGNLMIISLNNNFMKDEFVKYDVYQKVPRADMIVDEIYAYFSGKETLEVKEYDSREISHMADVKKVANGAKNVLIVSMILFFGIFFIVMYKDQEKMIENITELMMMGSVFASMFFLVFGTFLYKYFDIFFTGFHRILFADGTWTFNSREVIIQMFPIGVFFDIGTLTVIFIIMELLLFFVIGFMLSDKKRMIKIFGFLRPVHMIFGMMGVLLGGVIISDLNFDVFIGMVSIAFFIMASFVFNDIKDVKIDRVNKPGRVLPGNVISLKGARMITFLSLFLSLVMGFMVNRAFFVGIVIAGVVSVYYSMKKKDIFSSVLTAILFASVIIFGGLAAGELRKVSYHFFIFVMIFIFAREIIKDIEDIKGDRKYGLKTIPIVYGLRRSKLVIKISSIVSFLLSVALVREYGWVFFGILNVGNFLLFLSVGSRLKKAKHLIYIGLIIAYLAGLSTLWI